jgi:hypothetical protein
MSDADEARHALGRTINDLLIRLRELTDPEAQRRLEQEIRVLTRKLAELKLASLLGAAETVAATGAALKRH